MLTSEIVESTAAAASVSPWYEGIATSFFALLGFLTFHGLDQVQAWVRQWLT